MGTGIVSILLHNLPYNARWLYWISVVIFALNVLLFVLFTILSLVRYTFFPGLWTAMLRHPVQSLFIGKDLLATAASQMQKSCADSNHQGHFLWVLQQSST